MSAAKSGTKAQNFASLGLTAPLVATLTALGYEEPTPVQCEAIPLMLAGRDLLAQAATGTGKTAAFALPMIQRLVEDEAGRRQMRGLVLVPTRELAMQLSEAIHKYARGTGIQVVPLYGGVVDGTADSLAGPRRRHRRGNAGTGARSPASKDAHPRRHPRPDPGRGGRNAGHGLRRGHRRDSRGHGQDPPGDALFSDAAGAHPVDCQAAPVQSCPRHHRRRKDRDRQAAPHPPGCLCRPSRPEARGARSHPRHGESGLGNRVLPVRVSRSTPSARCSTRTATGPRRYMAGCSSASATRS